MKERRKKCGGSWDRTQVGRSAPARFAAVASTDEGSLSEVTPWLNPCALEQCNPFKELITSLSLQVKMFSAFKKVAKSGNTKIRYGCSYNNSRTNEVLLRFDEKLGFSMSPNVQ